MKMVIVIVVLFVSTLAVAEDKYVNETFGFEISALKPVETSAFYQHCVFYLPAIDGFAANVNVVIQNFGGTIEEYKKQSEGEFQKMELKTIKSAIEGGVYVIEYSGKMQNYDFHWFAKAMKKGERIYLATATAFETRWKSQGPILVESVNSFKVK